MEGEEGTQRRMTGSQQAALMCNSGSNATHPRDQRDKPCSDRNSTYPLDGYHMMEQTSRKKHALLVLRVARAKPDGAPACRTSGGFAGEPAEEEDLEVTDVDVERSMARREA